MQGCLQRVARERPSPPDLARCKPCRRPTTTSNTGCEHMKRIVLGLLAATAMSPRPLRRYQAGDHLRSRRQVRQVLQRSRLQRRRKVEGRIRARPICEFEIQNADQREQALRKFAEAGANPVVWPASPMPTPSPSSLTNSPRPISSSSTWSSTSRTCVRSSIKEQEGSYLVGMHGGHGFQDRQGRLRRRHGHSADLQVRLRLCRRLPSRPRPTAKCS